MSVTILDDNTSNDKYVLFRDKRYFYVVHEDHAHLMNKGTVGGSVRVHTADLVIDVNTGKVIKSRFTHPTA